MHDRYCLPLPRLLEVSFCRISVTSAAGVYDGIRYGNNAHMVVDVDVTALLERRESVSS